MATYEELFPDSPQEPFEPIQVGRSRLNALRRSAISLDGSVPVSDGGFADAFGDLLTRAPQPTVQGETEWADYGKTAIAGVGDLGGAVAGIGEYVFNWLAGDRSTPGAQTFGDIADQFATGRRLSTEFAQGWFERMSPEAQARAAREVFSLDPNNTIWQGGIREFLSSVGLKMARSAPSTVVTLLPGALIMRAGLSGGAITYLGASEGALSLGAIQANIAEEIEQAPEAELMQSPFYAQLRNQGVDDATARQQLIRESAGYAPVIGGLVVGAISAAAGRYLEPVFTDRAAGALGRFGRGFTSEAVQESGQSGAEQIAQNVAAQVFDAERGTFEGVPEAMGQGALVGGAMGGTTLAAIGPRPRTAIPTGEDTPTSPAEPSPAEPPPVQAAPGPEPFDQVFQDQLAPEGGWRGGDIEFGNLPDVDSTGQRLIQVGPIDAAQQAALNARAEGLIQDMFEQQPSMTPQQEQAAYMQRPWPVVQQEMDLSLRPEGPGVMVPPDEPQQLSLPMRARERGRPLIEPMPATPYEPDLSAPPGFSQEREPVNVMPIGRRPTRADFMRQRAEQDRAELYAGTVRDPRQIDMFDQPQLMSDESSAEPIGDLRAQLEDLADPDSPRLGVYISPANMQQIDEVPAVGVPLANFDGKGGMLIAKDRQTADELLAMRDQGIEMQEILGLATGAGSVPPVGADIVVQQRDEQGNVVRESLVATPEEADALAAQFDEPGREGVILSADMATKRRAQRIAAEQKQRTEQSIRKKAARRVEETTETISELEPGLEQFAKSRAAEYRVLQTRLADAERREAEGPTRSDRLKASAEAKELRRRIASLREYVEATVKEEAPRPREYFADVRKSLEELTDEQIGQMSDEQVEELFREAANVASGSRVARSATTDQTREVAEADATTTFSPHGKTLEEIVAAHPARSQKLKFISRVKRMLKMREHGGRIKTQPITATAAIRKGVGGSDAAAVRKSELRPTKAFDIFPPREMSKKDQAKHNERVRKTYQALDENVQAFIARELELTTQLARTAQEREDHGNPSQEARNAIYGRAYLRTLLRYGQMLQRLRPRSLAGLEEVERFNALADKLLNATPEKFLKNLATAMMAESDIQARAAGKAALRIDPGALKLMGSRRRRIAHILKSTDDLLEKIARAKRLHDVWHKNAKYEQHVAPLMQKLIGYVTRDTSLANLAIERRGLGYRPTFTEMRNLRYALRDFKRTDREQLYEPLKRWFQDYGFKFDANGDLVLARNAAQFDYMIPDRVLENERSAFRNAPLNANQKRAAWLRKRRDDMIAKERARRAKLTPAQRRREDLILAARIEKALRAEMSYEQRKALEALDRQSPLNLELHLLGQDLPGVKKAATALADALEAESTLPLNTALQRLRQTLPIDHQLMPLVERLIALNMDDAVVTWDHTGKVVGMKNLGHFDDTLTDSSGRRRRVIRLNRKLFEERRAFGDDVSWPLVHTFLHEAVHAATYGALANNSRLRVTMHAIMERAREQFRARGGFNDPAAHYGFKNVDEFVAETFSNPEFQTVLRSIQLDTEYDPATARFKRASIWDMVVNFVRKLLGLPELPQVQNALDLVMLTTDHLFTGEIRERSTGMEVALNLGVERPILSTVANVYDKVLQSNAVTKRVREFATDTIQANKEGGSRFLLSALTMEQIRDFYDDSFGGAHGPLARYMKAFFQRNADNAANMEKADKLSRRWTALTEKYGAEQSVELSRIMTESTLYGIHPDEPLQSKANEHVKSVPQKQRHADLAKRFKALPADFRALYQDLKQFYADSFRREVNLVTLNSLRAVVDGPFNYTEEDVERKKLGTIEGMKKEFGDRLSDTQRKIIARIAALPSLHIGPYFPLMRFGDYVVTAERVKERNHFADKKAAYAWAQEQRENDPTLSVSVAETDEGYMVTVKEKEVRFAETRSEAEQARQDMIAEYGAENVDREVQRKSQLFTRDSAISSGTGLRTILNKLDGNPAAQAAIKDFYLRSISDSAFRKREIKRANRRGVNYDLQHRTFAAYAKASAYYTSQLRFGWQMADALIDMDKYAKRVAKGEETSNISVVRMNEVIEEINTRDKLTHDHVEVPKFVRAGSELSQFMMLTSPSYWIINATQPYMVTLPWLAARSSIGEATAALTTAQRLIMHPLVNQMGESFGGLKALWSKAGAEKAFTVLEQVEEYIKQRGGERADEYIAMLNKLKRDSIIDLSFVAELRDISEGINTGPWQRVLDASRIMSHLVEVNNRVMTALAAYDLYRNKGRTVAEATGFAQQAVSLTQFNYSSGNAPRLFQARGPLGPWGPLVFQFMKYPQHMYALLIDNFRRAVWGGGLDRQVAIKTLVGLHITHLAAGGVIGAMIQPMKWAIGLFLAAFGDEDEPYTFKNAMSGETFDRLVRELTATLFGTDVGKIISGGLPRLVGADLSNRMSIGELYFIDMKTDTAESTIGSIVGSFGGPLMNIGMGWMRGAQYIREGQFSKGFESFMPKFAKDALKAIRYTNEGLTDATGKEILGAKEMTPWQLFMQSIGFQPSRVSEAYARRAAIKDAQSYDNERRAMLLRRYQLADADERRELLKEISEFNRANPAAGITRSQLLKSLRSFREREERMRRYGVDLRGDDILYAKRGEVYADD